MSPRRRSARKRDLPENLYERKGYYSWRNPIDGREYGLGRDRREAIIEAVEANIHVAGLTQQARLVDRLSGDAGRTLGAWLDTYEAKLQEREYRPNTLKSYLSILRMLRDRMDTAMPLARVETMQVAEVLGALKQEGKRRLAQAARSRLVDVFNGAIAEGWIKTNPAEVAERIRVKVQRARLSWEVFQTIYAGTRLDWLRNAMALALVSAQRREDIAAAQFHDFKGDAWRCEQIKTGNRLIIPLELRLDCFGMSLADVVRQCRRTGAVSTHLVHQTRPRGNSPVGRPMWIDRISKAFSEEIADLRADWGGRTPPTFHEIRSLSERLYNQQGDVNTQDLLGHKDPRSTQIYHDARGEWVAVRVKPAASE
jgi:integrase